MANRNDIENALKAKISELFYKLKEGKAKEEELKEKIRITYQETEKQEAYLPELHSKLKQLEDILQENEKTNDELRKELHDAELEAQNSEEYWEREKDWSTATVSKVKKTKQTYGDVLIETKELKTKAEDLCYDIVAIEKQLRDEEELYDAEEKRVHYMQNELDAITQKLSMFTARQEQLEATEEQQASRLEELKSRHYETENKTHEIEREVKSMETILDGLTDKLVIMKIEHEILQKDLVDAKQKLEIKNVHEEPLDYKTASLHKAQSISLWKRKK